jgi:hypothetical protein
MNLKNLVLTLSVSLILVCTAHAAKNDLSRASGDASTLPLAVSIVAAVGGAVLLTEGSGFVVKSVQASGQGAVWMLERASDGATASVEVAGQSASATAAMIGSTLTSSALASGVILSAAGQVIAFVPNALGRALLYHQPVK